MLVTLLTLTSLYLEVPQGDVDGPGDGPVPAQLLGGPHVHHHRGLGVEDVHKLLGGHVSGERGRLAIASHCHH